MKLLHSFTVWLRTGQSIIEDVEIANDRQEKRMLNSGPVGNKALGERDHGSSHDRHVKNSRTISRQRTKFSQAQSEDAGEHDGVEESDSEDAPHGNMSA